MTVVANLNRLLLRELETFRREVQLFPDDASLWQTAPGVTNSAGNLALHIAGNLRHFVGAVLGGTGYVRNREAEFGTKEGTRASVVKELEAAEAEVAATLAKLSDAELLFNAGFKWKLAGQVTLLASAGHTLREARGESSAFFSYLGLQTTF